MKTERNVKTTEVGKLRCWWCWWKERVYLWRTLILIYTDIYIYIITALPLDTIQILKSR